jgi:hypothetical protein
MLEKAWPGLRADGQRSARSQVRSDRAPAAETDRGDVRALVGDLPNRRERSTVVPKFSAEPVHAGSGGQQTRRL